jgi:hypothetical protein
MGHSSAAGHSPSGRAVHIRAFARHGESGARARFAFRISNATFLDPLLPQRSAFCCARGPAVTSCRGVRNAVAHPCSKLRTNHALSIASSPETSVEQQRVPMLLARLREIAGL